MSRTLDLSGYSIEIDGRELRMKPDADGYAAAFIWAFLMALLLGVQWWSFGESKDPRRVAFGKLSADEQTEFLRAGKEAEHRVELIQEQLSKLQVNSMLGKNVSSVMMEKITKLNNDLMKAKSRHGNLLFLNRHHPVQFLRWSIERVRFYLLFQLFFHLSFFLVFGLGLSTRVFLAKACSL